MLGLLLHEGMHLIQTSKGIHKTLARAQRNVLQLQKPRFMKLKYPQKQIKELLEEVGATTTLLLKDLFANTALIQENHAEYLIEYYTEELQGKRVCPRPIFYEKFKKAAQKNLKIIGVAFAFEFSLLSVILPFERLKEKKTEVLKKVIERCYEINIQEIARKCHELVGLYLMGYAPTQKFQEMFYDAIYDKVYTLLS